MTDKLEVTAPLPNVLVKTEPARIIARAEQGPQGSGGGGGGGGGTVSDVFTLADKAEFESFTPSDWQLDIFAGVMSGPIEPDPLFSPAWITVSTFTNAVYSWLTVRYALLCNGDGPASFYIKGYHPDEVWSLHTINAQARLSQVLGGLPHELRPSYYDPFNNKFNFVAVLDEHIDVEATLVIYKNFPP